MRRCGLLGLLGLLGPVGAAVLVVAVLVAAHRSGTHPLTGGYLSDLAGTGRPGADVYRLGLLAAAVGCLGVGAALVPRLGVRDPRVLLLAASAVDLVVQTVARCDGACRLPVAEAATAVPPGDAVHFVVAGAGFALWAATTALDVSAPGPVAPRLSVLATTSYVGHLALLGGLLLVDPYGPVSAALQRTLVLTGLVWVAVVGLACVARSRDECA